MDVESAFADGPFGSGSSEPAPHERGPTGEESVQREPAQRDAAESAKDDKRVASEASGRDDRDDDDGRDLDEGAPNLEKLHKALKSERSLTRKQRDEIKATLARVKELEQQHQQVSQQVAAIGRPPAQGVDAKKPEDEDDGFFTKGPEFVRNVVQAQVGPVQSALDQQRVSFQRTRIADAEETFIDRVEDGKEHLDAFKALAASDPSLVAQFEAVADGRHPHYRSPVKFAYEYAKEYARLNEMADPVAYRAKVRAEVEAELRGGKPAGGQAQGMTGRRTPLTLAGRRSGGSSVTPAQPEPVSVDQAFKF